MNRRDFLKMAGVGIAALTVPRGAAALAENVGKPNIIVILADDLGFSDLGCYGSEINTPNLDALAADGLRMTQVYNSARCCPSRASLMTGQHPHSVNFGGMSGSLPETCVTIPEVMRSAGYKTYMSGKWHLGTPGPVARGFDDFFGLLGGYGSYWNNALYTRLPKDRPGRTYESGKFYSTDAITDHAVDFIADARQVKQPFFMYLAYNAPHFPLHAPKDLIDKYMPVYEKGWDRIREERLLRMKKLGVVDGNCALSPRSSIPPNPVANKHGWTGKDNPAWDSLDADRRADLARRMAIYAAAVDRMDWNIGRVVADLKANGQLDNTLIFFLSDNGACAEWDPFGFDVFEGVDRVNLGTTQGDNILHAGGQLAKMGQPGTYHSYGSGWANACNTPLRLYKHYAHEGGISTPFIIHWPAGMKRKGEFDGRLGHVFDIMPTCVEVAGATYPKEINGKAILRMEGLSLCAAARSEPANERLLCFEHEGNRAVRSGTWKLVALAGRPWELYDEESDRVEFKDVASEHQDLVRKLSGEWDQWAMRCNVGRKKGAVKKGKQTDDDQ